VPPPIGDAGGSEILAVSKQGYVVILKRRTDKATRRRNYQMKVESVVLYISIMKTRIANFPIRHVKCAKPNPSAEANLDTSANCPDLQHLISLPLFFIIATTSNNAQIWRPLTYYKRLFEHNSLILTLLILIGNSLYPMCH
jgi:hypothetical protein